MQPTRKSVVKHSDNDTLRRKLCRVFILPISPSKAISEGPIDKPAFADEVLLIEVAEDAAVGAIELVVAHWEIMFGPHR